MLGEPVCRQPGDDLECAGLFEQMGRARNDLETLLRAQLTERELIERALAQAKGNKARAARLLGLTRPRLYRRMVQLGLEEGAEQLTSASPPPGDSIRRMARKKRRRDERMTLSAAADGPDGAAAKDTSDYIEDIPFEEQPE